MVNSSINALRSRRRRGRLSELNESPLTPEDEASRRQTRELFAKAVSELGGLQEQIVWLREIRGYSYPEISSLLGIPRGTVKSALHRGRARAWESLLALEQ
jgi:RNA polymerase sigma-70 factor (ECF subfamily)